MSGWPNISLAKEAMRAVACVLIAFVPGAIGSAFPPGDWYDGLAKPLLTPPGWMFPVAWTLLYITIGLALYLYLLRSRARRALAVFAVQLALNAAWSAIFFGLEAPGAALVEIVALWISIVATIVVFARHSPTAAKLLLPYLAWVSFATYLNFAIWRLN